jgi:hypothetical protein
VPSAPLFHDAIYPVLKPFARGTPDKPEGATPSKAIWLLINMQDYRFTDISVTSLMNVKYS